MLCYVFALMHNALYLWRIVITSNSYRFRLFAGVITSDSCRSEATGQHYCFTLLLLWAIYASVITSRKARRYSILAITLPSSSSILSHTIEKKEITPFTSYIFYYKIFKRALLFLRSHLMLCPNVETRIAELENLKTVLVPTFYLIPVPVPAPAPAPVPALVPVPAPVPGHIHFHIQIRLCICVRIRKSIHIHILKDILIQYTYIYEYYTYMCTYL